MKKSIIIPIIIIVIVILSFMWLKRDRGTEEELPTYPADIICTSYGVDKIDEDEMPFSTKVYLRTEDDYVTSAVYQILSLNQNDSMIDTIIKIYTNISGIELSKDTYKGYTVLTIKHQYKDIDLNNLNDKIGDMLDDESLFKKYDSFPITYEEYRSSELDGYECKKN